MVAAAIVIESAAAGANPSQPGMVCVPDGTDGYRKPDLGMNPYGPFNYGTTTRRSIECPHPTVPGAASIASFGVVFYDRNPNESQDLYLCLYHPDGSILYNMAGTCTAYADPPGVTGKRELTILTPGYLQSPPLQGFYSLYMLLPTKYSGQVSHMTSFYLVTF